MTTVIWACLLLLTLIIQATILPFIAINGIKPDLLLIVVVSTALLLGKEKGVGMGFFFRVIARFSIRKYFWPQCFV